MSETKPEKRCGEDRFFEPGFYEHYKGGIYYAAITALSNELTPKRIPLVIYFSLEKRIYNARPKDHPDYDSFLDYVFVKGAWRERFRLITGIEVAAMNLLEKYAKAFNTPTPPPLTPAPALALEQVYEDDRLKNR